jgi:hypothetical protein
MPRPQLEAPDLHLERARDCVGSSRTAWCADYWRGEHPSRGGGGGCHRSQISLPSRPKYTKMASLGESHSGFKPYSVWQLIKGLVQANS